MLIYVNIFWLKPVAGPADVIQQIAKWVGQRANGFVDGERPLRVVSGRKEAGGGTLWQALELLRVR
jgi:hypothetical protein